MVARGFGSRQPISAFSVPNAPFAQSLIENGELVAPHAVFTRAQASGARSTRQLQSGAWEECAPDTTRRHAARQRFLMEGAGENRIRNPRCIGAVAGGALPTHWSVGTAAGMTTTVISTQKIDGVDTVTIRVHGTATSEVYLLELETPTGAVAAPSQAFALSAFARVENAPLPPVRYRWRVTSRTSAGSGISGAVFVADQDFTSSLQRFTMTGTHSSNVTVARQLPFFEARLVNARAYDFTVTLGWPTLDTTLSTPILPAAGTVAASARGADRLHFPVTAGPLTVQLMAYPGSPRAEQTLLDLNDTTANNAARCVVAAAGTSLTAARVTAGVAASSTSLGVTAPGELVSLAWQYAPAGRVHANLRGRPSQSVIGAPTSGLTVLRVGGRADGTAPFVGEIEMLRISPQARSPLALPALAQAMGSAALAAPIEAVIFYGQSRAGNASEGTNICFPWATTAQEPSLALMMECPAEPGLPFGRAYEARWSTRFKPLRDCGPEQTFICDVGGTDTAVRFLQLGQSAGPLLYRLIAMDRAALLPERRWFFLATGVGGRDIATLAKGAAPFVGFHDTFVCYDRMIEAVTQANWIANNVYGVPFIVRVIGWAQGEEDGENGTPQATYETALAAMASNTTTDIQAITGQAVPPYFVTDLVTPAGDGSGNTTPISQAQQNVALADTTGRVFALGPVYQHPFKSYAHMSVEGVVAWAEQWADSLHPLITYGTAPTWLRRGAVSLSGNTITVATIGADGPLVLDTTTLPLAPNHGFALTGTAAVITGVSVSGTNITITCDASPAGGTLAYAHTLAGGNNSGATGYAGAYGNVRDASGVASVMVPGVTLRRFLASFSEVTL